MCEFGECPGDLNAVCVTEHGIELCVCKPGTTKIESSCLQGMDNFITIPEESDYTSFCRQLITELGTEYFNFLSGKIWHLT
jgi:hypothetical protein